MCSTWAELKRSRVSTTAHLQLKKEQWATYRLWVTDFCCFCFCLWFFPFNFPWWTKSKECLFNTFGWFIKNVIIFNDVLLSTSVLVWLSNTESWIYWMRKINIILALKMKGGKFVTHQFLLPRGLTLSLQFLSLVVVQQWDIYVYDWSKKNLFHWGVFSVTHLVDWRFVHFQQEWFHLCWYLRPLWRQKQQRQPLKETHILKITTCITQKF